MDNVFITNATTNMDISVRGKTLKPGKGDVFVEDVSKQDGVVAYVKRGFLKVEMVKESPGDGVSVGVVPKSDVVPEPMAPVPGTEPDNAPEGQPVGSGNDQPHDVSYASKKRKKESVV